MNRYFALLLLILAFPSLRAQTKTFEIGLSYETMVLSSLPIKVVEVLDGRDSTANIGWVRKGVKKVRRPTQFEKGFNRELFTFFRKYIQPSDHPRPLVVRISELRISELINGKETVAEAGLELEFFLQKDSNSYYFLTRIPILTRYAGMMDKYAHTYNIVDGFKYIFKQLDTLSFESRIKSQFLVTRGELVAGVDSGGVLTRTYPVLEEPLSKGIYTDFLEFSRNAPGRHEELDVEKKLRREKGWEEEYRVVPYLKKKDTRLRKVWGFSDGTQAFILFDESYWPVVLENGYAYFYAIRREQNVRAQVLGTVLFGVVGGAIVGVMAGPKSYPGKTVYFIDMATGRIEVMVEEGGQ